MNRASSELRDHISRIQGDFSIDELRQRLQPRHEDPPPRMPRARALSAEGVDRRWELLTDDAGCREQLADPQSVAQMQSYARNVENWIGTVKVPVGIAGPLRVNGLFARDDYFVPLATTEAALIGSYSRGAQLISDAGGCATLILNEGVSRAPGFAFRTLDQVGEFVMWAIGNLDEMRARAEGTTAHGKLLDMRVSVEGNHVYLSFEFTTGDASGQNMVTIATQAIYDFVLKNSPVEPEYSFLEANQSGDKKSSYQSFIAVRGRKVTAEVVLPAELVQRRLHTSPVQMERYWRMSAIGGVLSGTIGVQGHYANGLAALYIACGQDAACVAESAVGVTRFEIVDDGDLYASVTLPNVLVGTVGGGTGLPSQNACLSILGLTGPNQAPALAEVTAALCLAGELSIIGALTAGHFARAHQKLARGKTSPNEESQG